MPKLEITLPDGGKLSHELIDETITVGRVADNGLQIEDASVSSHHGTLTQEGSHYRLKDLGSTNGTYVNGEPVTDVLLKNSDYVRFGQIDAIYISDAAAPTRPLPEHGETPMAVATSSQRPSSFANASPFKASKKKKSPMVLAVFSFAGFAALMFAAALYMIFSLQPPQ